MNKTLSLCFEQELVVDLFAGGGGASLGLARAYREPDVAVNHDPIAVAVHRINHPTTKHYTCDVFEVDPLLATRNRPVGVLWASPDCRHHSKAAGGKPRSKRVRGLAWVVLRWAAACKPRIIHLENVEEFADWGPLVDGQPCKVRKGETFKRWVLGLERMGYKVEQRELIAADFGAPTIRKRLYIIARRDRLPIVWPNHTNAKQSSGMAGWRTAAECIDFSDLGSSIFNRKRQLKPNTLRRIARGAWRYVLNCSAPYIVPQSEISSAHHSDHDALVAPHLTEFANSSNQRSFAVNEALRTQCAQVKGGHFAMACAWMEQANTGLIGRSVASPISTLLSTCSQQRIGLAYFIKFYSQGGQWAGAEEPMHTVPTKDRIGLVNLDCQHTNDIDTDLLNRAKQCAAYLHEYLPEHFPVLADMVLVGDYILIDFTLRMLHPRELAKAQGFPENYILDRGLFELADGSLETRTITKTQQVRLIGNSVCPPVAEAIVRANTVHLRRLYSEQAA